MNTDNIIFVSWLLTWLPAIVAYFVEEVRR
jgi:hypothetical protein